MKQLVFPVIAGLTLAASLGWPIVQGEETSNEPQPARKRIFLPKNPVAAQYMLRRLSNEELLEVERSEPVYVALLTRQGLERKHRQEALKGLSEIRETDELTELLAGLRQLDTASSDADDNHETAVISELGQLLIEMRAQALTEGREAIEDLATGAEQPLMRQFGLAALVKADGTIEPIWNLTREEESLSLDFLRSVPLFSDPQWKASAYEKIEPLLRDVSGKPAPEVLQAAMNALASVPEREAESFGLIAQFIASDAHRNSAVEALLRIPKSHWPRDVAGPLADSLVRHATSVPAAERTEPAFLSAVQLGTELATLLPAEKGREIRKILGDLGVRIILLRAVPHQMIYDRSKLYVEAGKPVEIIFENTDIMPHNLVITVPDSRETVGLAADAMQALPDAREKQFIPDTPEVLHATNMLQPRETGKLSFTAPEQVGEYPYVCTYPGHWRRMFGTLHVVDDLDQVPLADLEPMETEFEVRPFVQEWTVSDLVSDLDQLDRGRSYDNGKKLFTVAACVSCHKMNEVGGIIGPDLTDIMKVRKYKSVDLLREIIEPSHEIDKKYRTQIIQTIEGKVITGIVIQEEDDALHLVTDPLQDCEPTVVKKEDIDDQIESKTSIMPAGLLNTLTREDILDLLAYIQAGGSPQHEAFQQ